MTPLTANPAHPTLTDQIMSDETFSAISDIALNEAGLLLPVSKKTMVQSRVARRLRARGCSNFHEYLRLLSAADGKSERKELISVLTTNVTSFFREAHHFETLAKVALPPLLELAKKRARVRIWSAGCSTGEEPFSIAMLLHHLAPEVSGLDVRILATDIDRSVLSRAHSGSFAAERLGAVPKDILRSCGIHQTAGEIIMPHHLKDMITFRQLNLHDEWPMRGCFDIIMCRNVVIYFDPASQRRLWPRFHASLKAGGWLFLGHSERIQRSDDPGFASRGVTTYQRHSNETPKSTANGERHGP